MTFLRFFRNLFLVVTMFRIFEAVWYVISGLLNNKEDAALAVIVFIAPFAVLTLLCQSGLWFVQASRREKGVGKNATRKFVGQPVLPPNRVWWGKGA
jgi:hypothetical protein